MFDGWQCAYDMLLEAVEDGDTCLLREALRQCRDGELERMNAEGYRPVHLAVWENEVEMIGMLVDAGADLEGRATKEQRCHTPLQLAVRLGRDEVVVELLACGADPLAKDDEGHDALQIAAKNGRLELAALLREKIAQAS